MALELSEIREEINNIDEQLLKLFLQRMDCSAKVAAYKVEHNMPVYNAAREQEILDKISAKSGEYGDSARLLYSTIMNISRALQYPSVTKKSPFRQVIDKAIAAHFSPHTVGYQG
ncbi:MAG: chorismate mutase, partial [Acutalibacteraceae bacterium]|nr:chorismate mutase [Acutalibacteraceae bacterium]